MVSSKRKPSCGTSTTLRRSDCLADLAHVDAVEQHRAGGRVHQPGEQLGDRRLARAGLADDGDPGAGRDVEVDVAQHRRAAGVGEGDVAKRTSIGPRGSTAPSGPGSTRSAGVSRMPITRRQPAIAFWASVRIWVPICTGPTKSVTRKAKASTLPAVRSWPSRRRQPTMPTTSTPALASPAEMPPSENETTVNPWARVLAAL